MWGGMQITKNSYQTIIETGTSDPQWDNFLAGVEYGHHEQSTFWAKVKEHQGWRAIRIKVVKGSDLVAGAQMLCKRLPVSGSVGYISSGPFYTDQCRDALEALVRSINQLAQTEKIQYIAITPYIEDDELSKILVQNGYSLKPEMLPPASTTTATLILDISKELDSLLMEMRYETRREIKLASKSAFTIREGGREDLGTLFRLMSITASRRGEKPVPNSVTIFENIWDYFHPSGFVNLLLVELEGNPVSAGFIFTFGNTVRFWKYGWSGEFSKKYPNQLLYWELIKWSKNSGFRYFEIVQVDPVVTDHFSSGLPVTDELKSRRVYGPTLFKTGFGGKVVKFSGPWFRFQNPIMRHVYRHFGRSLMSMPCTKKLISRIS
jgi:lipid II:glycine glycyltransferase (peptidoglycan interpeptide bridge formation enzyme)